MSQEIVLFHSALGLRPAVKRFADRLRAVGHVVHTPDLFDGETFDSLRDGTRKRDAIGIPELMKRANAAVTELPNALVYAGFSMGAAAAEHLAATRPGAKAAVLMHGAVAPANAGIQSWPTAVPVQVHVSKNDESVEEAEVEALRQAVRETGGRVEVFTYANSGHLFADEGLSDYNSASAWLLMERLLEFLARIDLGEQPTVEMSTERDVGVARIVDRSEVGERQGPSNVVTADNPSSADDAARRG